MTNQTSGDDQQLKLRKRMTRSVGLVLVGTAALMLGMPGGCDDHSDDGQASTRPSGRSSSSHYVHSGGGYRSGSSSYSRSPSSGSHTSRGGFGSTGSHVAS